MLKKIIEIPYFDSVTRQYQLKQNGTPVDITGQTLIFYLEKNNDATFESIEKNIGNEQWFDDPTQGKFHVVINTEVYLMDTGYYRAEIEWVDQKTSLAFLDISVIEDIRHS